MDDDTIHSDPNPIRRSRRRYRVSQDVADYPESEDDQPRRNPSTKKDKRTTRGVLSRFRSRPTKPTPISSTKEDESITEEAVIEESHIIEGPGTPQIQNNLNARPPPNEPRVRELLTNFIEEVVANFFKDLTMEKISRKNKEKFTKTIQSKVEEKLADRLDNLDRSYDYLERRVTAVEDGLRNMGYSVDGLHYSVFGVWGRPPGPGPFAMPPMSPMGGSGSSRMSRPPSQVPGGMGWDYHSRGHGSDGGLRRG